MTGGPPRPPESDGEIAVLLSLDRCEDALEELEVLKKLAPREPSVYFLLAKVYDKVSGDQRQSSVAAVALLFAFSYVNQTLLSFCFFSQPSSSDLVSSAARPAGQSTARHLVGD